MTAATVLAVLLSGCGNGRPAADRPAADHAAADSARVDTAMTDSLPLSPADSDSTAQRDTSRRGTPVGDPGAVPRPDVRLPRPSSDSLSGERS
ncbi:MAG TPA: hypothetical protein VFL88_11885 [Gemmatimonadales bacterium]|nr:hypothetical protein [Gemmatimonadales bacterium]